jgi:hypothetical protein
LALETEFEIKKGCLIQFMVMSKKPLEKTAPENAIISFGRIEHVIRVNEEMEKSNALVGLSKDGFVYGNQLIKIQDSYASVKVGSLD